MAEVWLTMIITGLCVGILAHIIGSDACKRARDDGYESGLLAGAREAREEHARRMRALDRDPARPGGIGRAVVRDADIRRTRPFDT